MIIDEHLSARLVIVQRCQEREGGRGRKWEEVGGSGRKWEEQKWRYKGRKGLHVGSVLAENFFRDMPFYTPRCNR